jgi:hypothetical protein
VVVADVSSCQTGKKQKRQKAGRSFIVEYGVLISKPGDFLQPLVKLVHSIPYGKAIVVALIFFC